MSESWKLSEKHQFESPVVSILESFGTKRVPIVVRNMPSKNSVETSVQKGSAGHASEMVVRLVGPLKKQEFTDILIF